VDYTLLTNWDDEFPAGEQPANAAPKHFQLNFIFQLGG
jgi:hypothetical protein